jgi:hypothetical protein
MRLVCFITLSLYNEILNLRVCSFREANFCHKVVIKRYSLVQYAEVLFIFIQDYCSISLLEVMTETISLLQGKFFDIAAGLQSD